MSPDKDDRAYLWDMPTAAKAVTQFVQERTLEETDPATCTACSQSIAIRRGTNVMTRDDSLTRQIEPYRRKN